MHMYICMHMCMLCACACACCRGDTVQGGFRVQSLPSYLSSKGGRNAGRFGSLIFFTSWRATLVGFGVGACLVVEVKMSVSPLRRTAWYADGSPRDVFGATSELTFHHVPPYCVPRCILIQPMSCG